MKRPLSIFYLISVLKFIINCYNNFIPALHLADVNNRSYFVNFVLQMQKTYTLRCCSVSVLSFFVLYQTIQSDKYSLSRLKDISALYINLVLVAPPPFAAFKSSSIMSLLPLYFTFHIKSYYLFMRSQAYASFYCMILFR